LQCVLRLETLDDIDNTAPSHKFSDDGDDSLRLAWHHRDFFREIVFVFIVIPFVVEISKRVRAPQR